MALPDGYTVIKNVSGVTMSFSFLPPHGLTLEDDEQVSIPGDYPNALALLKRKRKFKALEDAVAASRLEIVSRPGIPAV